jgi:hypothetical protein
LIALLVAQTVTWIHVPKPTFDVAGVLLAALGLTGLCALAALILGGALGLGLVLRARRRPPVTWANEGLLLLDARRL